jgi:hypothetical protein
MHYPTFIGMTQRAAGISRTVGINTLRPFFRAVGNLPQYRLASPFQKLTTFDKFIRFFVAQTKGYPNVNQGWFGSLLQRYLPQYKWQQHHVLIQQSWFRQGGPNQWYPNDVLANKGMRMLANAGFNLMALPAGVNSVLGRSAFLTFSTATTTYGSMATAVYYIYDLVSSDYESESK